MEPPPLGLPTTLTVSIDFESGFGAPNFFSYNPFNATKYTFLRYIVLDTGTDWSGRTAVTWNGMVWTGQAQLYGKSHGSPLNSSLFGNTFQSVPNDGTVIPYYPTPSDPRYLKVVHLLLGFNIGYDLARNFLWCGMVISEFGNWPFRDKVITTSGILYPQFLPSSPMTPDPSLTLTPTPSGTPFHPLVYPACATQPAMPVVAKVGNGVLNNVITNRFGRASYFHNGNIGGSGFQVVRIPMRPPGSTDESYALYLRDLNIL